MKIKDLVADITMEHQIPRHRLRRASTLGIIRDDARVSSLARQEIIIESHCMEETEEDADKRLAVLNEIISSERGYCNLLQSIFTTYKEPLRKSPSMPKSDHTRIFSSVKQMVTVSATFLTKLEEVASSWNPHTSTIGSLFDDDFLEEYKEYYAHFRVIRLLLVFLRNNNKDFVHLCHEKRGSSWHTLDSLLLLPVQRVSQYDKYLSEYYDHTPPRHPDYRDVCQGARNVRMMVKEREDEVTILENEIRLQQVQDRFPHDDLQLIDRDTKSQRFKALANRRRSAPTVALKTALGGKKLPSGSPSPGDLAVPTDSNALSSSNNNRVYVMEGAIQVTGGDQAQSRYVFLFNDVLIVAKPNKSCSTFRVKHRIRVSELWLATCINDVIELNKPADRSFVVGWPVTNTVWTFSSPEEKELWWQALQKNITVQREREEPKTVNLKVLNRESRGSGSVHRTVQVGNTETVDETLRTCLQHFQLDDAQPEDYGLWVQSGKDSLAYPLIGHEIPYAIKMSHLHDALSKNSYGDLLLPGEDEATASAAIDDASFKQHRCQFFLRRKGESRLGISVDTSVFPTQNKRLKKARKTHFKLSFKKSISVKGDLPDAFSPPLSPNSQLFGIPLPVLCQDSALPGPLLDLLTSLYHNGPFTTGIFRKSANARVTRELKAKLCAGESVMFEEVPITVAAALLKDFLRNVPNGVMYNVLYENWVNTNNVEGTEQRICAIKSVVNDMPASHCNLLRHLMCIMYHISQRSDENNMNAYNQAVCCSPSMLWAPSSSGSMAQVQATEKVPQIVQFMVNNAPEIFGVDLLDLFGGPPIKRPEPNRRDSSGDSDSFHGSGEAGGMKRDDSSLDSIDRELSGNEGWPSTLPVLSPSTLSRDSVLTSSDNQLYPESDTTDTTDSGVDAKDRLGCSSSPGPTVPGIKHTRSSSSIEKGEGNYVEPAYLRPEVAYVRRVSEPDTSMPRKRYVLTKSHSAMHSEDNSPEGSDNEVELSEDTVRMIRELSEECSFKLFSDLLPDEESGPEGDGLKKALDKRRQDYLKSQKSQQAETERPSMDSSAKSVTASMEIMGHSSSSLASEKNSLSQRHKQRRISVPAKFYNPLTVFHKKATPVKHDTPSTSSSEGLSADSSEKLSLSHADMVGRSVKESGPRHPIMDNRSSPLPQQRSRRPRISSSRPLGKLSPDGHRRGVTFPETNTPPREFFPRDATHLSLSKSGHTDTRRMMPGRSNPTMTRSLSDEQIKNSQSCTDDANDDVSRNSQSVSSPRNQSSFHDSSRQDSPPSYQETMHRRAHLQHRSHSLDKGDAPMFDSEESQPRRRRSGAQTCNISRSQPLCRLPSSPYSKSPTKTSPIVESGIIFHISDSESSDEGTVDMESLRQFSTSPSSLQLKEVKQVRRTSSDRSARADGRTQSFANAMVAGVQRTLSDKRTAPNDEESPQTRLFYGQEATLTAQSPRAHHSATPKRTLEESTTRSARNFTRSRSMEENKLHSKATRIDSVDSAISTSSEMSPSSGRSFTNSPFSSQAQSAGAEQGSLSPQAKSTMQDYFLSTDPVNGMAVCKETEKAVTKSRQDWRHLTAKRHSLSFLDELDHVEFTEESYV
ncbi:uncharacterized protein LOC110985084 isoform X2 [Acanthaster planci]|nr:uncharacterized protein LOC110985084 isoform X2 [Acanthaster planci]